MRPERNSKRLLAITRTKAKMYEYDIPEGYHIRIDEDPSILFDLTIGVLGDVCHIGHRNEEIEESRKTLLFSAHYFDAFLNSKLNGYQSDYLKLLASSAYYLCGFPGSSSVLLNQVEAPDCGASSLDRLLWAILRNDFSQDVEQPWGGNYEESLKTLHRGMRDFFQQGLGAEELKSSWENLNQQVYSGGGDRELLLSDVIKAVCEHKIEVATWNAIPRLSEIPLETWRPFLERQNIRELWPAQMMLGEHGVFKGRSAVVQMPTSAGKTKATELVIRSAFLSGRTKMAVIVAPYRALCHEINDNMAGQFEDEEVKINLVSDVLQEDVAVEDFQEKIVLILTPEKLDYFLRHSPEVHEQIGLVVYDEGHMFDDSSRGVTYELLLASLRRKLHRNTQVILISAVIGNAEEIGGWLTGDESDCVSGRDLHPTYRTIAFTSWRDRLGRLQFHNPAEEDTATFFVPRVLESQKLELRGRERVERFFPKKDEPGHVALYLGCKLVKNGAVAVFSGRKDSANKMGAEIVDAFSRGLNLATPDEFSDINELNKLVNLYKSNLGEESNQTEASRLGIFLHHANTPHGIRLALEHALQKSLVKFVICTSTLAQGVNLPLKYLIVTTDRQGREKIRTRDFHNLMGRAGRAGMYTEGTVIFSNPDIFDKRIALTERWRWREALELLKPENSEPCKSAIFSIFTPVTDHKHNTIREFNPVELAKIYFEKRDEFNEMPGSMAEEISTERNLKANIAHISEHFRQKADVFKSIGSFLLQLSSEIEEVGETPTALELLENTLVHFQADETQRETLAELFRYVERHILETEPSREKRAVFSKTVLDFGDCERLLRYVESVREQITEIFEIDELFDVLWPAIYGFNKNKALLSYGDKEALRTAGLAWLRGSSFTRILKYFAETRFGTRIPTLDHVIDVCENGFGFQGSLIVGAIVEILSVEVPVEDDVKKRLMHLQRALKYGLPTKTAIIVYELGLVDRQLAQKLLEEVNITGDTMYAVVESIKENDEKVARIVSTFPAYFEFKLRGILSS